MYHALTSLDDRCGSLPQRLGLFRCKSQLIRPGLSVVFSAQVRFGCSRAKLGTQSLECCLAAPSPDVRPCKDPVDLPNDFSTNRCSWNATASGETMPKEQISTVVDRVVIREAKLCTNRCEKRFAVGSCDHCACVHGCNTIVRTGSTFQTCLATACANQKAPPADSSGKSCAAYSTKCRGRGPQDACNTGCSIPNNQAVVGTSSTNPPILHLEPPPNACMQTVQYTPIRKPKSLLTMS